MLVSEMSLLHKFGMLLWVNCCLADEFNLKFFRIIYHRNWFLPITFIIDLHNVIVHTPTLFWLLLSSIASNLAICIFFYPLWTILSLLFFLYVRLYSEYAARDTTPIDLSRMLRDGINATPHQLVKSARFLCRGNLITYTI